MNSFHDGSPTLVVLLVDGGQDIMLSKKRLQAVHCVAINGLRDGSSPTTSAPMVDRGQVMSSKEGCQPFMVVIIIYSPMKGAPSILINFVDVNLWVLKQQLHHIVVMSS